MLLPSVLAASAAAQLPPQISIRWSVPASCPRTPTADAELAARLGTDAAELQKTAIDVRLEERAPDRYSLQLEARSASGELERTVELSSCAEAQRAATVLIATALAPGSALRLPPPQPSQARWSLRAALLGDLRSLPQPSLGPGLGAGCALGNFRLWAEARYLVARETAPLPVLRARVDLFGMAVGAGWIWERGPWQVGPGLELEAGVLRGRAEDGYAAGGGVAPWISAWAGALAGYTAGRVGVYVSALAGVPFVRPQFYLLDQNVVYTTENVGARLHLAMQIALGTKKGRPAGQ